MATAASLISPLAWQYTLQGDLSDQAHLYWVWPPHNPLHSQFCCVYSSNSKSVVGPWPAPLVPTPMMWMPCRYMYMCSFIWTTLRALSGTCTRLPHYVWLSVWKHTRFVWYHHSTCNQAIYTHVLYVYCTCMCILWEILLVWCSWVVLRTWTIRMVASLNLQ